MQAQAQLLQETRALTAGNKAELQVRLTEAREDQGDLKSWIKRLDEEEAWANIESDEGLPSGVASAADQRIYRMFRLERRRQELDEDQKRLYSMVDEQQQQSNALSSADAAELEAIAAAAQRSEEFSVPELRDMISQYQAGNKDKGKQAGRKVAGTAEVSGMGTDQQRASLAGASTQDSPAQDLQSADIEAAYPQDLSSYKCDACIPAHDCCMPSGLLIGFAVLLQPYLLSFHACPSNSQRCFTAEQRCHD